MPTPKQTVPAPAVPVLGVLIDLDDTLYPQAEFLSAALDAVADAGAARGLDRDALRAELARSMQLGSDRGGVIDAAVAAVGAPAEAAAPLVAAFKEFRPRALTPYPGVAERLARLTALVRVVVVTDGNPAQQRAKLAATGLRVSGAVYTDEGAGRMSRKPAPYGFRRGLSRLGRGAAEVVMVGDRPDKDVAGAAALGIRTIRVRQGEYRDRPDGAAWRSAASTAEALDLLLAEVSR